MDIDKKHINGQSLKRRLFSLCKGGDTCGTERQKTDRRKDTNGCKRAENDRKADETREIEGG